MMRLVKGFLPPGSSLFSSASDGLWTLGIAHSMSQQAEIRGRSPSKAVIYVRLGGDIRHSKMIHPCSMVFC